MKEVIEQLRAGDHIALFYKSKGEQFACAIPYLQIGLERGERCLYIADDNSVALVRRRLQEAGVDVDGAERSGALQVVTKHETYLRHGIFEPAKMIGDLRREVEESLAAGFTALRASGEMTWALDLPSSLARLMEYEADLHAQLPEKFLGLCQYDESRFPENVISGMIEIHPIVIARGQLVRHAYYRGDYRHQHGRSAPVSVGELVSS
jgi:hypothetical protein